MFFFSSRRRHTRFDCDWSSDVCSSDLAVPDSASVLWRQVVGIATPSELRAWWAGVPPEAKGTWLESFWARRNPNLFASTNHRIVEHFSRLRYARKHYPLLHPLVSYHRSSVARTLNLEPAQGEREFHLRCEVFKALPPYYSGGRVPLPGVSSVRDRARVATDPAAHLTTEEKESMPRNTRRGLEAMGVVLSPTLFVPLGMDLRARTLWRRVWATTSLQGWTTAESCTCASGHRTRRGWVGTIRSTRSATRTNWSGGGTPSGERCASSGRARSPRDCAPRRRWSSGR